MSNTELYGIMPLTILSLFAVSIMLVVAVKRNHMLIFITSVIGFAAAFYSLFNVSNLAPVKVSTLLVVDNYTLFYWGLLFAASFFIVLISYGSISISSGRKEEYYIFLFIAVLGSAVLVASINFISFFLGLELLSISLYVLVSYLREKEISIEAGVKYLMLAAASSAFLLFGMALFYVEYGTMNFYELGNGLNQLGFTPIAYGGTAFIIIAVAFKLAVVPFHMWTPDVYEGASSPVTAFIATISKGGMFALFLRFFTIIDIYKYDKLLLIFGIIAVVSMFTGNWLALKQVNVKRILAYSSIAHLGYLLVAFIAGGKLASEAAAFYLTAYFITTIGAFGVVTVLSSKDSEAYKIEDYSGLYWKHPWLSITFTAVLLSLAGIPLTAGFIGKYYVLAAGADKMLWGLVIILVINSSIGLYYYLRIVVQLFSKKEAGGEKERLSSVTSFALVALTILLIVFGVYPTWIIGIIKSMVSLV